MPHLDVFTFSCVVMQNISCTKITFKDGRISESSVYCAPPVKEKSRCDKVEEKSSVF
jgi:hypothetical protein